MGESYAKLVIQPIDLIRAFKVDFCLASVIKWLTKWQMEKKSEYLQRARYYVGLCDCVYPTAFLFSLRMYCIVNGFMKGDNSSTCILFSAVQEIVNGNNDLANMKIRAALNP